MAARQILPIDFLRECFSYDAETGILRWKTRPTSHFPYASAADDWNNQHAGTRAFAKVDASRYCRAEVRYRGERLRLTGGRVAFALHHGWVPHIVDHADGDTANNKAGNLRAATDEQNMWNRHAGKDRGGIPRGVARTGNRWSAGATHNGRRVRLGAFETAEEAHLAYKHFVEGARGEFANLGPVKVEFGAFA